ncbi:MAG: hypothetical protein PHH28_09815 [Desulfuromonadaceae bacterium]|nr:hypothetical protein [Desulfuromonadaceae bacterium]
MDVSGVSSHSVTTAQAALTPQKPEVTTTPHTAKTEATLPQHDTVELTGAALAKSLKLSGQKPAQIALKMGVDIKTVDQYLSIKVAAPITTAAPVTSPAPEVKQTTPNTTTTPQISTPADETTESGSQKTTETAQGKK